MKKSARQSERRKARHPKKKGQFQTLKTGLQTIVEELEKQLELTKIYKGTKVVGIERGLGITASSLTTARCFMRMRPSSPLLIKRFAITDEDWLLGCGIWSQRLSPM